MPADCVRAVTPSGGGDHAMIVLALDAAAGGYGAALLDGERTLARRVDPAGGSRRASAGLLPAVADAMRDGDRRLADIDLIAVVTGPGSYTGVRVALATAKGIGLALGLATVGVDALEALAFAAGPVPGDVLAALPAGRGRLYGGRLRWEGDRPRLVEGPLVVDPAAWASFLPGAPRTGWSGGTAAEAEPPARPTPVIDPSAVGRLGALLAAAGQATSPERLLPRYGGEPRLGTARRSLPGRE